jgi:molybdopterin converting factor small subunit
MNHAAGPVMDAASGPADGSVSGPGPSGGSVPVAVTVRYFAAARAAATVEEERVTAAPTVGAVLEVARAAHGPELDRVLSRCSYLLDGIAVHGPDTTVVDGAVLDVLPPFAGG